MKGMAALHGGILSVQQGVTIRMKVTLNVQAHLYRWEPLQFATAFLAASQ
jgi:hypothetical protein